MTVLIGGCVCVAVGHTVTAERDEVVDLIACLASDGTAAIHGAQFVIDGGTVRTL